MGHRKRRHPVAPDEVRTVDGFDAARARKSVRRNVMPAPLSSMPAHVRAGISYVLTDIDDTLTTDGKLTADAYRALEQLHDAGLIVVPVTGRPAGWCDHIARMWPVDAVVGENGAFYMRFDSAQRKLVRRFVAGDAERAAMRAGLEAIGARIVGAAHGRAP